MLALKIIGFYMQQKFDVCNYDILVDTGKWQ